MYRSTHPPHVNSACWQEQCLKLAASRTYTPQPLPSKFHTYWPSTLPGAHLYSCPSPHTAPDPHHSWLLCTSPGRNLRLNGSRTCGEMFTFRTFTVSPPCARPTSESCQTPCSRTGSMTSSLWVQWKGSGREGRGRPLWCDIPDVPNARQSPRDPAWRRPRGNDKTLPYKSPSAAISALPCPSSPQGLQTTRSAGRDCGRAETGKPLEIT